MIRRYPKLKRLHKSAQGGEEMSEKAEGPKKAVSQGSEIMVSVQRLQATISSVATLPKSRQKAMDAIIPKEQ